jgi:hypothetical protein
MCTPNVSKNDDDNGNGKRLGSFLFQLRDTEDLLFAAQITAST